MDDHDQPKFFFFFILFYFLAILVDSESALGFGNLGGAEAILKC